MKKRLWEMAVGILYILILFYQLTKAENIKVTWELPGQAAAGNRVSTEIEFSGCREKSLHVRIAYDGTRLVYCKRAGIKTLEGSSVLVSESGTEEEKILDISIFAGKGFLNQGKIILEFYVRREYGEIPVKVKLCRGKEKNPCCRIDNNFRRNYNGGNGFAEKVLQKQNTQKRRTIAI